MLGAGAAHLEFLSRWAKRPVPGVRITLIARAERYFEPALVPYAVAGDHDMSRLVIDIEPLAQRAKAVWTDAQVQALDATAKAILLDDGRELRYDWLGVDQEPAQMRAHADIAMPGARKNGLFVRPLEAFAMLWPKVVGMAQPTPVRVAVIADQMGGLPALELAFATRERLPGAALTLITGGEPLALSLAEPLRQRLASLLRARNITVLADRATAIDPGEVALGSGARLACDVPLMITRAHAPAWMAQSGLQLDADGFVAVDDCLRAASHTNVFCNAGPLGFDALHADARAALIAGNLMAVACGKPLSRSRSKSITMLRYGKGQALASWGSVCLQGYLPGWFKARADSRLTRICHTHLTGD